MQSRIKLTELSNYENFQFVLGYLQILMKILPLKQRSQVTEDSINTR